MGYAWNELLTRGYCSYWNTRTIIPFILSNVFVALVYYAIPWILYKSVQKESKELILKGYKDIVLLFCLFIFFCGTGHLLDIFSIWWPNPFIRGYWTFGTALVSLMSLTALDHKLRPRR